MKAVQSYHGVSVQPINVNGALERLSKMPVSSIITVGAFGAGIYILHKTSFKYVDGKFSFFYNCA